MLACIRRRWWARVAASAVVCCLWGVRPASADPTPAQILDYRKPTQAGVEISTPSPDKLAACKVELVRGSGNATGWLLSDANGPIRRFFDANGDKRIDSFSFYKDGVEVYREIDSNHDGKVDQYRWFNSAGARWGLDPDQDGVIDTWKVISPEEVSQEIIQAVSRKDFARLQALLLTEADLQALKLPAAEAQRLKTSLAQARRKFEELTARLSSGQALTWLHLEMGIPQCRPAEEGGVERLVHPRGAILYESGGKTDVLQTGEMILVGRAWKLTGAPFAGVVVERAPTTAPNATVTENPQLQKLIAQLSELDKNPPTPTTPGPSKEVAEYNLKRSEILKQIVSVVEPKERDTWIRQVADSLSTAAQNSTPDQTTARTLLAALEKQITDSLPNTPLAGYVAFRVLQADYSAEMQKTNVDYTRLQQEWVGKLTRFVQTYPRADDTPEALLQLGMVNEFLGKEVEARNWYAKLAADFTDKPQAAKARGAVKRLECEGKPLELTGSTLDGASFDIASLRGKVVVVYYWASWNQQSVGDFAKLKLLVDAYGSKGLEVVGVNLDSASEEASAFIKKVSPVGKHLHQPGGLEGKLATDYGVTVLPHLFLLGPDGKVVSRTVQVGNLETELKKLIK
jgi:thiol-disulfide isomerase/thioredoxin